MKSDLGNKETMALNIKTLLEHKGITAKDLATALNVPPTTVYGWVNATCYPRIDKIELMARFFGVPKSELVESEAIKKSAKEELLQRVFADRPGMVQLFSVMDGATEEEIAQAVKVIEALRK